MTKNHPINQEISKAIKNNVFPGASLLVGKGDQVLWNEVYGKAQVEPVSRDVKQSTFFDIASLTKPIATASLFMIAVQEGNCSLKDELGKFLQSASNKNIKIEQLLKHSSGLPAWKAYYEKLIADAPGWIADEKGKDWLIKQILEEPLEQSPGERVVYSDLGYILLGHILEIIYNEPLEDIFKHKISHPLELKNTFFNPLDRHKEKVNANPADFAATENCPWREKVLIGEVMDDHAYLMGGVAGHAGLFSTAQDIKKWINELQKAKQGKSSLISQDTFNLFFSVPKSRDPQLPFFTLGFDIPTDNSSSGTHFSSNSIGHLGYSGCSFWWDINQDVYIILLTNRVHPSRDNDKIKEARPKIHDVIWESLIG